MADNKTIKFQFMVDEASLQKTRNLIRGITSDLQKMAEASGRGGQGGGGIFGGLNVGTGKGPSAENQKIVQKAPVQTRGIVQNVLDHKDLFKGVADGTEKAMKGMTDALKRATATQRQEVGSLRRELKELERSYDSLNGKAKGRAQGRMFDLRDQLKGATGRLGELDGLGAGTSAGPTSLFGRMRAGINGGVGGTPMTMAGMQGALSGIPGLGGLAGMAMGAAPLAMLGKIAQMGFQTAGNQVSANMNRTWIMGDARAQSAADNSTFGRKIRGGDLSDIRAMRAIGRDSEKSADMEMYTGKGKDLRGWMERQSMRWDAFKDAPGGWKEGLSAATDTDSAGFQKIARRNQRRMIDQQTAEQGMLNDILGEATQNAGGKLGLQRSMGIGNGFKKTGAYRSNAELFLQSFKGFTNDEVMSGMQGIAGSGSRAASKNGGLLNSVLQATGAGVHGAAGMAGTFSRQGIGTGKAFSDNLRSMVGGGVDVSNASLIGGYAANAADRMNVTGYNGTGTMGMLSAGANGADGGVVTRQNIQGAGLMQQSLSGGRDSWQKAMNFQIAVSAAPGAGYYAQQYLAQNITVEEAAEIMAGNGRVTDFERELGITVPMKRAVAKKILDSQKHRASGKGFAPGSGAGSMLSAWQGGSNMRQYAFKNFAGKDGKWTGAERKKATATFAAVMRSTNQNLTESEAMGLARNQLFGLGRKSDAKMASAVGLGSNEAAELGAEKTKEGVETRMRDADAKRTLEDIKISEQAYKRLASNVTNMVLTADNVGKILTDLAKDLKAIIENPSGGGKPNQKVQPKK
jgi:hypothetical protein